jgi:hypothetical protein
MLMFLFGAVIGVGIGYFLGFENDLDPKEVIKDAYSDLKLYIEKLRRNY